MGTGSCKFREYSAGGHVSALTIPTSFTEKWWPRESRHAPVLPVSQCEKNLEPSTQLRRLSSFRYFDEITGEFMLSSRAPHFSVSGPYTGIWSGSLGRAAKAGTRLPSQHHTPPSGAERKQNACRWGPSPGCLDSTENRVLRGQALGFGGKAASGQPAVPPGPLLPFLPCECFLGAEGGGVLPELPPALSPPVECTPMTR